MTDDVREWRVSDVVAYDTMRESANAVIASLLARAREGSDVAAAYSEIAGIQRTLVELDGHDRGLALTQTTVFERRLDELRA